MGKKKILLGILLVIVVVISYYLLIWSSTVKIDASFVGNSSELRKTNIVATLDTPVEEGMNTIWCASFVAAWKSIERDITKEPVALEGDPEIATRLNNAPDPSQYVPASNLYAITGWNDQGIQEQIRKDLAIRFPAKEAPVFPDIRADAFLAYAYLEVNLPFKYKYERNHEALFFSDHNGEKTPVTSFGLPESVPHNYRLKKQAMVLYEDMNENQELSDFAIDLDRSSQDDQIVVACITPESTLEESLKKVQKRIADTRANDVGYFPPTVLLVPDTVWQIAHSFTEIEGLKFTNPTMKGQKISTTIQDTQFRLDHKGAVLKSESKLFQTASGHPHSGHYIFDKPFLIYMKKRDADRPYFVMWVANAELLNPWIED